MISEERLEELIKQGATIYKVVDNKVYQLRQDHLKYWIVKEDRIEWYTKIVPSGAEYILFNHLFETKEEAEFYKNYKNIKSTHILDLPTWEELQKTACFYFKDYYGEDCIMRDDVDEITVEGTIDNEPYRRELATWTFPRTEDGYLSACEICKKLFLGEIDD